MGIWRVSIPYEEQNPFEFPGAFLMLIQIMVLFIIEKSYEVCGVYLQSA